MSPPLLRSKVCRSRKSNNELFKTLKVHGNLTSSSARAPSMRWSPALARALLRVKGIKRPSDLARLHACFLVYIARKLFT
jgi:hypothetical protein